MMAFLSAGQSFAQEEIRVVSPSVLTVPVALTQETEIRNIDISVTCNPAVLEIKDIALIGGIFENQKDYIQENRILGKGRFGVVIYSVGNLLTTKGNAVFLKISVIGKEGERSSLTLSRFDVNDTPAAGGFRINDSFSRSVSFLVNQRPIAEHGTLITDEDTVVLGTLKAADNDSDMLTFRIITEATKGKVEITNAGTGEYVYKPGTNENGTDAFTYLVSDGFSDSDIASVTITLSHVNDPPAFNSTPNTAAGQNSPYTYSIATSDIDADDTRGITAPTLPAWLTLTDHGNGSATLSGTPDSSHLGDHAVTLRVTDKVGASTEQSFTILVKNTNDAPTFTTTPNTAAEQDLLYTYAVASTDSDAGDILTVTAPTLPAWLTLTDNGNGGATLAGTPDNSQVGVHAVTLRLTDKTGASADQSFTILVKNANDAPTFTTTPNTAAEQNVLYTYAITTSDIDAGDSLSITAPRLPVWLTLTDNGNGAATLSGTPTDAHSGNNEVILEVKDSTGLTATQSFTILVKNINDSPLITGQKSLLTMPENSRMTLTLDNLLVQDPDDRFPEDFTLTVDDGENYSRYGNTISPFPDFEGILTVPLKVNDGEADSNVFSLEITVTRVNNPPAAEAQTVICAEDTEFLIRLTGSDPDGDPLSYFISALPRNGSLYLTSDGTSRSEIISQVPHFLSDPQVIYVPPTDSNGDAYGDFRFSVNDSSEYSVEALIIVNVTPVNDSPVLNEGWYSNLSDTDENDFAASGDMVSALVSGMIKDPDGTPENAIAVTAADNSGGIWQYALAGAEWQNFSDALGDNQALLLSGECRVRFVPYQDWSGTAEITFRAWDRTSGNEGETVTISETGGTTAFSSNTNTGLLVVHALPVSGLKAENDSPTLIGTETHFTASAEIGSHIVYTWDFGDETSAQGASLSHTYSDLGVYATAVTAQNSVSTVTAGTLVTICADALTVSNDGDAGKGSLRYAIENICQNGSITFSSSLARGTVIVVNSPLLLNKDMSIQNQTVPNLAISGDKKKRIFEIEPNIAVEMQGLTISDGYAEDGLGGGIYNQGNLTLTNCTLFGNSADARNGVIDSEGRVSLYVGDSGGDSSTGFGAGAVFNTGVMTLLQCTLSGNIIRADDGIGKGAVAGGIFNSHNMQMSHCTLAANIAEKKSAEVLGVGALCNFLGSANLEHSLIAKNTGDESADVYGVFVSKGHNLIGDITGSQGWEGEKGDIGGSKENPMDPILGELTDKGVFTQTQALLTGSPATDAGNPDFKMPPVFDQRGKEDFPRVHDGDGDGDAVIDIGAYEFSFGFISAPLTHINKGEEYRYVIITTGLGLAADRVVTAAEPVPKWLTLKDNMDGTASLIGTPAGEDVGEHRIVLQLENIYSGMKEFQVFNITVADVNIAPRIVGQKNLQTEEETSMTVTLNDLSVDDSDNIFPDDFTLQVRDGDNYISEDNTITPNAGFTGALNIPVTVNDGKDESNVFILSVSVTAIQKNVPPQITGQNTLVTQEETPLIVSLNDLSVKDTDSSFPNDFTLQVKDGDNYHREGNTITPNAGFSGTLNIPVTVNDGKNESEVFILTVSVTAIQKNIPPQIIGQNDLQTKQETSLTIRLNDLSVNDPDNIFPDDFTLQVKDEDNYIRDGNTVKPNAGFIGTLKIPVTVNDGQDNSELFFITVSVTAFQKNTRPQITGQKELSIPAETPFTVMLNDLSVNDSDNIFPNDFTLQVGDGDNYSREGNTVTPMSGFIGTLRIPVTVNDGQDNSEVFFLSVSVSKPENVQIITGKVIFPRDALIGETARMTAFSASRNSGNDVQIKFEGNAEVPYAINGLFHADDYIVSAESDYYTKRYYDGSESGSENREDARAVQTGSPAAETVRFILESELSVSGRIIDADSGAGLAAVAVEAWSDITSSGKVAHSSTDGTYIIRGLRRAADFKIAAWKTNVAPFFYNTETTVRERKDASLVSLENGNRGNIVIEVREEKSIYGTIRDQAGNPVSMIWIYAKSESRNAEHGVFSAEDGTYLIDGLPVADDYKVSVQPDAAYIAEEKENVSMDSDTDFTLKLREIYKLSGAVRDEYGNDIEDVDVEIISNSGRFYSWNRKDAASGNEDIHGYEITGIPPGDYLLRAMPPEDSAYAVFCTDKLSIHEDTEIDITLTPAMKISGTVYDDTNTAIPGVSVIAVSEEKNFEEKAITDKDGFYEITHVPDASDYLVTAFSENYILQEKAIPYPDRGIDFILESGGFFKGEVKSTNTGEPLADAWVEVYSEQFGAMPHFSASVRTDENGRYEVKGLKQYQDGNPVDDYIIAVYSSQYAPRSVSGKKSGETVDFSLESGRAIYDAAGAVMGFQGKLLGMVTDFQGNLQAGVILDIFITDGNFVQSLVTGSDGTFSVENLSPETTYQLRFTNEETMQVQWAGEGDIGFDEPDPDSDTNPENAKSYDAAGVMINFRFGDVSSSSSSSSSSAHSRSRLGNQRSARAGESRVRVLRVSPSASLFNTPNITAVWETSGDVSEESYYYVFNQSSDHEITKRNVPRIRPMTARRAVSKDIIADDIPYYCHVAPVDERGRIGETAQVSFRIDTVAPYCPNVTMPKKISTQYVTVKPGATGASEMYISNTGYGENGQWERWTNAVEWKLTQGQGEKNIYVLFRDRAENTAKALGTTERTASVAADQHKIVAGAGVNGKISPAGYVSADEGDDKTFTILPDAGYEADKLFINGKSVPISGDSYTFYDVSEDASIAVTFRAKVILTYTITVTFGANGTVTPSGEVIVTQGDDVNFSITPDAGYEINKVLLNGKEVRLSDDGMFHFINVSQNYALNVTFKAKGLQ
ncbi:MAG: hypothetical protein BWK80_18215 [Desulfobacteraceae bacterium IS3]|nr:MAG: hypothetical protein BWK80_18215 [Desulfobacteraceae bacterium IS3]